MIEVSDDAHEVTAALDRLANAHFGAGNQGRPIVSTRDVEWPGGGQPRELAILRGGAAPSERAADAVWWPARWPRRWAGWQGGGGRGSGMSRNTVIKAEARCAPGSSLPIVSGPPVAATQVVRTSSLACSRPSTSWCTHRPGATRCRPALDVQVDRQAGRRAECARAIKVIGDSVAQAAHRWATSLQAPSKQNEGTPIPTETPSSAT